MKTIYKYSIGVGYERRIFSLPRGYKILGFGEDAFTRISFWALVDTSAEMEDVPLFCVGTGWNLEEDTEMDFDKNNYEHIGTHTTESGYVWHLFKEIPKEDK